MTKKQPENDVDANKFGPFAAISYVVGSIIGTGIFISPSEILKNTGSVGLSLAAWLICGIATMIGALCYVELGTSIRLSGSSFAYQTYVGWNAIAFSSTFTKAIIMFPGGAGILMTTIGSYIIEAILMVVCMPDWSKELLRKLFGLLTLYILMWLNFYSIEKYAAKVQIASLFLKLGALMFITITGLYYIASGRTGETLGNIMAGTELSSTGVILALNAGFWAYGGWDTINYGLEDVKKPKRDLTIAALGGTTIVIVAYLLTNVAYFAVLGVDGMFLSDAVVVTFCHKSFGPIVAAIIPGVVGVMAAFTMNVSLFKSSRQIYAAARRGHFPTYLSGISPETSSPRPALVSFTFLATIMLIIGDLRTLLSYVNFIGWFEHMISACVLLWIHFRKIPVHPGAIKMPVVLHLIFLLNCAFMVFLPAYNDPKLGGIGFAFIIGGVGLYYLVVTNSKLPACLSKFNNCTTKFAQVLFLVMPVVFDEEEMKKEKENMKKIFPKNAKNTPSSFKHQIEQEGEKHVRKFVERF